MPSKCQLWSHHLFLSPAASFCHVNIAHQVSFVTFSVVQKGGKKTPTYRQQPYDKWIFRLHELWMSHAALGCTRLPSSFKVWRAKVSRFYARPRCVYVLEYLCISIFYALHSFVLRIDCKFDGIANR